MLLDQSQPTDPEIERTRCVSRMRYKHYIGRNAPKRVCQKPTAKLRKRTNSATRKAAFSQNKINIPTCGLEIS